MKGVTARTIALLTLALIVLVLLAYQVYLSFREGSKELSYYDCINLLQARCLVQGSCDEDCENCKSIIGCKNCCGSGDDCCLKVLPQQK